MAKYYKNALNNEFITCIADLHNSSLNTKTMGIQGQFVIKCSGVIA